MVATRSLTGLALLVVALACAAAAFAPLAASVAYFLGLPARGQSVEELGWPVGAADAPPGFVLVDDDGRAAWIGTGPRVCRLDLATARMSRCAEMPDDARGRVQHARAAGRLLLVFGEAGDPLDLQALLLDDAGAREPLRLGWRDAYAHGGMTSLANVAWNPARTRFELVLDAHDAQRGLFVVPLDPERGAFGAEEAFPVHAWALPPRVSRAPVLAAFDGTPPTLLLADPTFAPSAWIARGGEAEKVAFDADACARAGAPTECVALASRAGYERRVPIALWVDARGDVRRMRDGWNASREMLTERANAPVVARRFDDVVLAPVGDGEAALAWSARGGEEVLFAKRTGAEQWTPVARAISPDGAWVIPWAEGLLWVDAASRAIVRLDATLARADAVDALPRAEQLVVERAAASPRAVAAYVALLVAFPALLVWAAAIVVRERARPERRRAARAALALVAYAACAGSLVAIGAGSLFPP